MNSERVGRFGLNAEIAEAKIRPSYLLIADVAHLFVAAAVMTYLLFFDIPVNGFIMLLLTAAIMWIMARGWTWVVLSCLLVNILLREPRSFNAWIDWGTILYAWLCLCLVAYTAGYRTLRRQLRYCLGLGLQTLLQPGTDQRVGQSKNPLAIQAAEPPAANSAQSIKSLFWEAAAIARRLSGWLLIVLAATIVFGQLPLSRAGQNLWWQRSVDMQLNLWPGPMVFSIAIASLILMNVWYWRGLTSGQAGLYLRTTTMTYYFRDARSILGRLKKLKRK